MKPGKVSESVYKRSILKRITFQSESVCQKIGVGTDAAMFQKSEGYPVMASASVTMVKNKIGYLAVHRAANQMAAMGAVGKGAWVHFFFPGWFMESHMKAEITELHDAAASLGIEIAGVHAESLPQMEYPIMNLSLYGETFFPLQGAKAGMDIVMTKDAGTEGAGILTLEREEELLKRYTPSFVDGIKNALSTISAVEAAAVAVKHGVKAMHTIQEGGVFGALWEVAEAAKTGLEVDLKQIPIRQETIEVCEWFDLNPYLIPSAGSLLLLTEDGYHLAESLRKEKIPAKVIGRLTQGNDRLLWNEEEKRFLELPKRNELFSALIKE